jgi:hypothetical protein
MTDRHGIASIDDARKRRERRGLTPDSPRPPAPRQPDPEPEPEPELQDYSAALDMADGALYDDHEAGAAPTRADAILAQHEAAAADNAGGVALEPEPEAPADEILQKLEGHHQQGEPHQRYATPRGSADLDPRQPQRPRVKPIKVPKTHRALRSRRRWLAAGGIAAVLVAMGAAVGTSGTASPTIPKPAAQQVASATNQLTANLRAGDYPFHGRLTASHHKPATSKHPTRAHRPVHHAKKLAPAHTAAASSTSTPSSTSSSSTGTGSASSGSSYSSTPAAQSSSSDSGSSQSSGAASTPAPAGPAGAGGTVGSNCNPKCS